MYIYRYLGGQNVFINNALIKQNINDIFLKGVAVALMTSYAIQNIPIQKWGSLCIEVITYILNYNINMKSYEKIMAS